MVLFVLNLLGIVVVLFFVIGNNVLMICCLVISGVDNLSFFVIGFVFLIGYVWYSFNFILFVLVFNIKIVFLILYVLEGFIDFVIFFICGGIIK